MSSYGIRTLLWPMQLLTSPTGPNWVELESDADDARGTLDATLRQLLGAERLVVLTGLGTSMSIEDGEGEHPAPSMKDLWNGAHARVGPERWDAALARAHWDEDADPDIELLLTRCQMARTLTGDQELAAFIRDCEEYIVESCSFVTPELQLPHHEAFLRRVARRPTRLPRTQLFTTNYDLVFEEAAARTGFTLIDGFSHGGVPTFTGGSFDIDIAVRDRERASSAVEWVPNVMHLLKLHGSVDWKLEGDRIVRARAADAPLIIYPRSSKFEVSYQQPFLELMGRFQTALRRPDTALLIAGSGLADRHVLEPVLAAVRSNVRMSVLAASPDLVDSDRQHAQTFRDYIARGDRRLTLLAATFDEFVAVLPDLVPSSETERHQQRMSAA
jgi:hypothetical protein